MSAFRSALYLGRVGHARLRPKRHRLSYRSFMLLLDLDELDALSRRLRAFSRDRLNLFGFSERDHGDGSARPLREQVAGHLVAAGMAEPLGAVRLLCLPRMLGYVFNPLSLYFCYDPDERLIAILYEVNSTFGERHTYVIAAGDGVGPVRQTAAKRLHVSPFMEMQLTYLFTVDAPDAHVRVRVEARDGDGAVLTAAFAGRRRALGDAALIGVFFAYPLHTLMVMAAIHWEAVKLLAKGLRLRAGPPAPKPAVSHGAAVQPSSR